MTELPGPTVLQGRRRILFVTHTSEWIGPNISLVQLVTRAPDWVEPVVLVPDEGPLSTELDRHQVACRRGGRLNKYAIPRIAGIIRRYGIDLVYGNSAHGTSRNALIAAKMCGRPFVYHLREIGGNARTRSVAFLRLADAVIAVSRATADSYGPFLHNPAVVIYNGVPEEYFAESQQETRRRLRSELDVPAEAPVVVHVGNVYRRKAQKVAVRTFQHLKERHSDARLFLLGRQDRDPEYVRELKEMINHVDPSRHIHLLGLRPDVKDFMSTSDIFLHTATEDPHPRAVIEAMAAGLPVVAMAVDGVRETVLDGECGFLVEPPANPKRLADRLCEIIRTPALGERMGACGRERAQRLFSAERTAREVYRLIERVLQTSGRWV